MTAVTTKKSQKTEFVVRAGSRAVYRGDSARDARAGAAQDWRHGADVNPHK
ncbi:MAG: hypothetical protein IPN63_07700 [Gammaproteobacteria bacterium]|nr:hypothetical protein [Gammaproteobacteria bacterium]